MSVFVPADRNTDWRTAGEDGRGEGEGHRGEVEGYRGVRGICRGIEKGNREGMKRASYTNTYPALLLLVCTCTV